MNHKSYQDFIPGPHESAEQFEARAAYCLKLKETMPSVDTPFFEKALAHTSALYGIAPKWVPLVLSNEKLAPWHGGCAWIFQMSEDAPLGAYLQIRRNLWFYQPEELLAHELCHIGRMAFEEKRFEEFFAYRTSKGPRAYFGPIIQSSTESMLFVLSLFVTLLADLFTLFVDDSAYETALWLKVLPLSLILLAIIRLVWRHHQLDRCIERLSTIAPGRAEALAYRLTDDEIINGFDLKGDTPRWQHIREAFFTTEHTEITERK